jgi:hypothetical protein
MYRVTSSFILLISFAVIFGGILRAQEDPAAASATCNFDEEKQLMVQYQHVPFNLKKPLSTQVSFGKPWAPGGKAMTLFTNTPVQIGSRLLPVGAYTMFVIPNSKQWTLIVSKSTDTSGAYDEAQDLIRVPMESGELPTPEPTFSVAFAHVAPQQCNIRVDAEKTGHFATFHQK